MKKNGSSPWSNIYSPLLRPLIPGLAAIVLALAVSGCSGKDDKGAPLKPESSPVAAAGKAYPASLSAGADAASGKTVYDKYCRYCHGDKGRGDGAVGIALTPHPADFVNDTKRMSKSDEELLKSITDGIQRDIGGESMSMPRWREILTDKERLDVLAYVRQLEREGKAEAVKTGK